MATHTMKQNSNVGESKEEMEGTGEDVLFPQPTLARIKNKQRRQELYKKLKQEKKKEKMKARKDRQKQRELLGDKAPPKQVPHTIESLRIPEETMVDPEDEEVAYDEMNDEMAPYFRRETTPKIAITTREKAGRRTRTLAYELQSCIPNSEVFKRKPYHSFKKMIQGAIERDFTDVIVINEDKAKPNGLYISHLPEGPTLFFKMNSVKLRKEIKRCGESTGHKPELILNNFNTRLGHSVGRVFASLFDHDPEFKGRRVVTFHNQRDYIFFRHHRYVFRNAQRAGIHELGPRFTLRLRTLQKGTFDSKFGEYEWIHKRKEMDTSRRKFHL
ncbi:ribosome production factor 1-like [Amphiura filiformis]|uniref:ribosome production factor 1-like n=1 Tax=Amphiura filiformis TaxID=82378 RepID=UPI003B222566